MWHTRQREATVEIALQVFIGVVLLLVGAMAAILIENFIKRPKLVVSGSGGGGGPGPGFYRNHITIRNEPGQFGLKLKSTTILGKRVHGSIEMGQVFDRTPAHECRAFLYDKASGESMGLLWWRALPTAEAFTQTITLNSGESAELMLFARLNDERSKYFKFDPESSSETIPKVPDDELKLSDTRDFVVEIQYFYGKKKIRVNISMIRRLDGRLSYRSASGGGSF